MVYKYLKLHDRFSLQSAVDRRRQIDLRVRESLLHEELNPLAYDEANNCLASRFVPGRHATEAEALSLVRDLERTRRAYLMDVNQGNILVEGARLVVIDFIVVEQHIQFRLRELAHLL